MPPGQGQCETQRISAYFGRCARHFTCNRRANKSLGNNEKSHRSLPAQGACLRVPVSDAIRLLVRSASPTRELSALGRKQVWLTLGVGSVGFGGLFCVLSYIAPTLTGVAGLPDRDVPHKVNKEYRPVS